VYEDGDSEEMTRDEVLAALCTDEEISNLSPSKTTSISQISEEFDSKNPEACFRGMLSNRPTGEDSHHPSSSRSFVKSEAGDEDRDDDEEEFEDHDSRADEAEMLGGHLLLRDDCGRFESLNKPRRPRSILRDEAEEDAPNGKVKRRRRKSCPFLPTRKRRSRSHSHLSAAEDSPSQSSHSTPSLSTPIKRPRGRMKKERSDSISESVVSVSAVSVTSVISTSNGEMASPSSDASVVIVSNDSESASVIEEAIPRGEEEQQQQQGMSIERAVDQS
jgi:hypothetical protein